MEKSGCQGVTDPIDQCVRHHVSAAVEKVSVSWSCSGAPGAVQSSSGSLCDRYFSLTWFIKSRTYMDAVACAEVESYTMMMMI